MNRCAIFSIVWKVEISWNLVWIEVIQH